jgi:hypothetical protein
VNGCRVRVRISAARHIIVDHEDVAIRKRRKRHDAVDVDVDV